MRARREPGRRDDIIGYFSGRHCCVEKAGEAYKPTSRGMWASARPEALVSFFDTLTLKKYRRFGDLGCGDGVAVCCAALFVERAIGIEADLELCRQARDNAQALGLGDRCAFVCADFLDVPLDSFDVLYIYPDKPLDALYKKLKGWSGALLVYGPHFPPQGLLPVTTYTWERETLRLYQWS